MTEESRVSRTPRTLLGWTVPADMHVKTGPFGVVHHLTCRHNSHEGGFPGRIIGEGESDARGQVERWFRLHAHGGEVVEVLPDAPEPQPASSIPQEIYSAHQYQSGQMREPGQIEDLCTCGEWVENWVEHHAAEAARIRPERAAEVSSVSPEGETTPGEGEGCREATSCVLAEVAAERARQDAKWGEQNHPDIWPDSPVGLRDWYANRANDWKRDNAHRVECGAIAGMPTDRNAAWDGILLEEVYEALAESDPEKLRAELVQVAAVAVNWIEAIDRRPLSGVELRSTEERDATSEDQP